MGFGPRRTTNENAAAYFERLTSAGHGSVLEHASYNSLLYGVTTNVTTNSCDTGRYASTLRHALSQAV